MRTAPLILALLIAPLLCAQEQSAEVRALWVQRSSMTSPLAIRSLVQAAKGAGFNTLLVQVRGRGDAYYRSRFEPRAVALSKQLPSFDPLATALAEGHAAGLRVHAWMNVNLIADAAPPALSDHLVHTHPEWLMVPRELAVEMSDIEPRSSEYLRRLSRYASDHSDRIEGLYLSPIQPAVVDHTVRVIDEVADRYPVDGIHLDYIRFPSAEFDYGPAALSQFHAYLQPLLTADERRQYEQRARGEPLFYTQMFPQRWQDFRQERLTALVTRLRTAVKARRPKAALSAAVVPGVDEAATNRLQDWKTWLERGLLDAVCPMAYTTDPAVFRAQIAGVKRLAGTRPVWAGIGAFQLSALETILNIRAARQLGAQGVILFSYDNLMTGANAKGDYLAHVGRDAFGH